MVAGHYYYARGWTNMGPPILTIT